MDETLGKVSPPTKEPCSIYPAVRGIDCGNFQRPDFYDASRYEEFNPATD